MSMNHKGGVGARPAPRRWRLLTVCLASSLLFAACGSTKFTTSQPSAPTSTTDTTTHRGPLAGAVVPAPVGYAISTSPADPNGPVSATDFDKYTGVTGLAKAFGFTGGFEETYDAVDTSETIEVILLEFASDSQRSAFMPTAIEAFISNDEAPSRQNYTAIAGAVELVPTKAGKDGFYVHTVVAWRGNRIMAVDYVNDQAGDLPQNARALIARQYSQL